MDATGVTGGLLVEVLYKAFEEVEVWSREFMDNRADVGKSLVKGGIVVT